jgi:GNAT superfamily N-acetyltransferase
MPVGVWGTLVLVTLPTELAVRGASVVLRESTAADLTAIVRLLADDALGAGRESLDGAGGLEPYLAAFRAIDADPSHLLLVATMGRDFVATMQLVFLPGLSRRGALRAQVEAVRVATPHRDRGIGTAVVTWALEEAQRRGCAFVQLTSHKSRVDAHRFYARLGFRASHEGMKLAL